MSDRKTRNGKAYKSTEQLEVICDRAEQAYWKVCHQLPEWTAWQMAEKLRDKDRHELRQAFYVKAKDLPDWQVYEKAWRTLQKRYKRSPSL